ncbi:MAG: tetratricopeptide repeat protein, partial [Chloroflexota bacterium]
ERILMADEIVRHADRYFEWKVWQPLLQYTGGNPLTLQVLVTQAVRDGIRTQEAMRDFVEQLRRGEVNFHDDATQGRSKSLGASLAYGYDAAFSEEERAQLAVLHLFQGFVDANALVHMGHDISDNTLSALNGKDSDYFVSLLDKASNIGVLRKLGGIWYDIHPALPWFLKTEFETHYPTPDERERAQLAYTEAIGYWGNKYANKYMSGQRDVIHLLAREESNLLHARRFAISNQRWGDVIETMQGLSMLYNLHGRHGERRYLVKEIIPYFCHPETDMPLPDRTTEQWSLIMQYRVRILQEERDWEEAERLQLIRTTVWRDETQILLNKSIDILTDNERSQIRSLSMSMGELARIQREQGEVICINNYKEAYDLLLRIEDLSAAATVAFNLGHAYRKTGAASDLENAEKWYQRSLDLTPKGDFWGRATSLGQLGLVAYERFIEVRAEKNWENATEHIRTALTHYQDALSLFPANAINELAVTHNQLGIIYRSVGEITQALDHYQKSVHYDEQADNHYSAANTRYNMALLFESQGQFEHAMVYTDATLKGYQLYGERTAQEQAKVMRLIERIKAEMQGGE